MNALTREIAALAVMTAARLRTKYRELFGEDPKSGNCDWMRKRITWRIQSLAEGGLSERAKQRAGELANDADLRTCVPNGHPVLALVTPVSIATTETEATTKEKPMPTGPRLHQPMRQVQPEPAVVVQQPSDDRLPPTGTVLTKVYKGRAIHVTVLGDGFEYEGEKYTSLSALAKHITGSHCNGFAFFNLNRKGAK